MPRPVYIICHQAGTEDRETGLISLFFFIEKIQVTEYETPPGTQMLIAPISFRVVAAWMRSPEDLPDQEYDYALILHFPPGAADASLVLAKGIFRFEDNRPIHRFTINVRGQLPSGIDGILTVESKVRRDGDTEWLSQDYPMVVETTRPAQENIAPV